MSMYNIQWLSGSGGSWKYCCKYVGEIDKNNYFTVSKSADGSLIRREIFLHNTKRVTSDKVQQEEQENKWNWKHPQGAFISVNEVWHHIMNFPEVITNLNFVMIQKIVGNKNWKVTTKSWKSNKQKFTQFDANVTNHSEKIVKRPNKLRKLLSTNCHFSESQSVMQEDMQL